MPLLPRKFSAPARTRVLVWVGTGLLALLSACSTPPAPQVRQTAPQPPVEALAPSPPPHAISHANTPRAYRRDAAHHLYTRNSSRIYSGKMPPLLYAIGVLEVHIDQRGEVTGLHWMRAPRHAPEVVAEIERAVKAAAPYPAPVQLGRVTYTDTWLWHKSGRFQLDTLTEGQM